MYFLVKKPNWLIFNPNEYADEEVRTLQVRFKENKTNTKIIKFKDGSWYIKNGSQLLPLKNVDTKNTMYLGKKNEENVTIEGDVVKKWFIGSNNMAKK